jgi:hypothetical protein
MVTEVIICDICKGTTTKTNAKDSWLLYDLSQATDLLKKSIEIVEWNENYIEYSGHACCISCVQGVIGRELSKWNGKTADNYERSA